MIDQMELGSPENPLEGLGIIPEDPVIPLLPVLGVSEVGRHRQEGGMHSVACIVDEVVRRWGTGA